MNALDRQSRRKERADSIMLGCLPIALVLILVFGFALLALSR